MEFRINKTDFHRQIGAVHHTKRVRKPNKDEADQDGRRFSDQLELASQEEEHSRNPEEKHEHRTTEKKPAQKSGEEEGEESSPKNPLGGHIDIKI